MKQKGTKICESLSTMLKCLMSYLKMKMGNAKREMEIIRKKLKTVTEMKNASYRLIIRLNIDEERISEFEVRPIEIFQPETQKGQ